MSETIILRPDDFPLNVRNPLAKGHHHVSDYMRGLSDAEAVILGEPDSTQVLVARAGIERLVWLLRGAGCTSDAFTAWLKLPGESRHVATVQGLLSALDYARTPLRAVDAQDFAVELADFYGTDPSAPALNLRAYYFPIDKVLRYFEKCHALGALNPNALAALRRLSIALRQCYATSNKVQARMGRLVDERFLPDAGEAWADAVRAEVEALPQDGSIAWCDVYRHAVTAEGAKPSAKWLRDAESRRRGIGETQFQKSLADWMERVVPPVSFTHPPLPPWPPGYGRSAEAREQYEAENRDALDAYYQARSDYLSRNSRKNIALLKGLAWYSSCSSNAELAQAMAHMAEATLHYAPDPGVQPRSAGNAAIWALGQMPGGVGVASLARLRTRLRDRGALKLIASAIESAARNAGMSVAELEDLAVPGGGLDMDGTRKVVFDMDGSAVLTLDAKTAKTNLQWFGPDGKPRKAVPAAVKANHAAEVKALKAAEAEIKQALNAQAARFDKFLLDERAWTLGQWRDRYLSHPILGNIARRLIWTVDGLPALPDDLPADLPASATVRLWHPLEASPGDVLGWRQRLEAQGIVQPFKQAHREVYLLTDAERNTHTYSNRFAAHVLKQHQFNSLCVLRGWKNSLRLMVDDAYPPATRELPRHNLRAEFWVEGIGDDYGTDTNETGTYLRLVTDQVRFYPLDAPQNYAHAGGGGYTGTNWRHGPAEAVPLDQIPPLAFSEVMRDVDLFVGVASLGNDPNWADGGAQGRYAQYWHDYAFGDLTETAKTRADVLLRLLPRLKIADRCRLDGKFLVVRGDLRTYKIHLGSGNILMAPNDQYLCIVPGSRSEDAQGNLFLPFEGDRTLAVVLSKAFLLAADTKITDPTITRQIGVN